MDRGVIPINKEFELQYHYFDKDQKFKYFNRKFEIILVEKKPLNRNYVMHMDNADPRQMIPCVYKASTGRKKHEFKVTTINWNDIKTKFIDYIVEEIGEKQRGNVKKAIGKLSSPKI
jgi:hypothetical protein